MNFYNFILNFFKRFRNSILSILNIKSILQIIKIEYQIDAISFFKFSFNFIRVNNFKWVIKN